MSHAKHRNQVRITGGTHRGRKLPFADAEGLRPTPDSVRQRLFNWLGQDLTGQTVADVFAGSGALGLDAASRHAKHVYLCDNNPQTAARLKRIIAELKLPNAQAACADALHFLIGLPPCDLILLDPPFVWQDWPKLFAALRPCLNHGASVYLEAAALPPLPDWLQPHREGRAGQSRFALLHYRPQITE